MERTVCALLAQCGLGKPLRPISPVSGGLMHRMYDVQTEKGRFAVKWLNAQIMQRPEAADNFRRAEEMESMLESAGIPVVAALRLRGRKMQRLENAFFYIFDWQDGHVTDWNAISLRQCRTAGSILGRIHAIAPQQDDEWPAKRVCTNWAAYAEKARAQGSEIAPLLEKNAALLAQAERQYSDALDHLPPIKCLSDADMDPKNVMWTGDEAHVIDLESLDYGNPAQDAMQLAMQWAGAATCNVDIDKMLAFFDGYLHAYDNGFRAYDAIYGAVYSWTEWLEYNVQRALGACIDDQEQTLGVRETANTINRIVYLHENAARVQAALRMHLSAAGRKNG